MSSGGGFARQPPQNDMFKLDFGVVGEHQIVDDFDDFRRGSDVVFGEKSS